MSADVLLVGMTVMAFGGWFTAIRFAMQLSRLRRAAKP